MWRCCEVMQLLTAALDVTLLCSHASSLHSLLLLLLLVLQHLILHAPTRALLSNFTLIHCCSGGYCGSCLADDTSLLVAIALTAVLRICCCTSKTLQCCLLLLVFASQQQQHCMLVKVAGSKKNHFSGWSSFAFRCRCRAKSGRR